MVLQAEINQVILKGKAKVVLGLTKAAPKARSDMIYK